MRTIWTLFKISIALAITIPVALFALALTVGVVGTFVGLAIAALRLGCIALVAYGVYRMARLLFAPTSTSATPVPSELPTADPYYVTAMRELESELRR
jgi:hypothetical protein